MVIWRRISTRNYDEENDHYDHYYDSLGSSYDYLETYYYLGTYDYYHYLDPSYHKLEIDHDHSKFYD